jgi:hypothetical protein
MTLQTGCSSTALNPHLLVGKLRTTLVAEILQQTLTTRFKNMDNDKPCSALARDLNPADASFSTTAQPKSFLDLPLEIRLAVYGHFACIPPKEDAPTKKAEDLNEAPTKKMEELWTVQIGGSRKEQTTKDTGNPEQGTHIVANEGPSSTQNSTTSTATESSESYRVIKATRYSLLLTCKSIHEEWAPLFWSTTTVALGFTTQTDPATFERAFLARIDEYKLRSIRHLMYCPMIWEYRDLVALALNRCDFRGFLKLGRILQTYPALLSGLEDLRVTFQPRHLLPQNYVFNARGGQTVEDKWTDMDPNGVWDTFVQRVSGGEAAKAWKVERSIGFEAFKIVPDGGVYCWIAARWEMRCESSDPSKDGSEDGDD